MRTRTPCPSRPTHAAAGNDPFPCSSNRDEAGVGMRSRTPLGLQVLPTVVIADDESSMRLLVHATIESDDYTVIEACDGAEAWAMVKQYRPSLVLLDVQM